MLVICSHIVVTLCSCHVLYPVERDGLAYHKPERDQTTR